MKKTYVVFAAALVLLLTACQTTKGGTQLTVSPAEIVPADYSFYKSTSINRYLDSYFQTGDTAHLDQIIACADSEDAILAMLEKACADGTLSEDWIPYFAIQNNNGAFSCYYDLDYYSLYYLIAGSENCVDDMKRLYTLAPELASRNSEKTAAYFTLFKWSVLREDIRQYVARKLPGLTAKTQHVFADFFCMSDNDWDFTKQRLNSNTKTDTYAFPSYVGKTMPRENAMRFCWNYGAVFPDSSWSISTYAMNELTSNADFSEYYFYGTAVSAMMVNDCGVVEIDYFRYDDERTSSAGWDRMVMIRTDDNQVVCARIINQSLDREPVLPFDFSKNGGKTLDGYWDSYFDTYDTYWIDQVIACAGSEEAFLPALTKAYEEGKVEDRFLSFLGVTYRNGVLTSDYDMDFVTVYFMKNGDKEIVDSMKYLYSLLPNDVLVRNSVKSSAFWSLGSLSNQRSDIRQYVEKKLPMLSEKTRTTFDAFYHLTPSAN